MAPSATTARFGEVAYSAEDVLAVHGGIPPFLEARRFVLVSAEEEEPFVWLQSLDEPGLAVALAPLGLLFPEHDAQIRKALKRRRNLRAAGSVGVYGVVVLHPDPGRMTINLAAPVVVDAERMTAEQVILDVPVCMTQYPLIEALRSSPPS